MKQRPNLKNFFYLAGSGLIIQLSGTVYRIWMAREIGPEGLGIMQMVYPIYRLLSGLSTIGLPLALTKWISEYIATGDHYSISVLRKWAVKVVTISSISLGTLLFCFTPLISETFFTDPRINEAIKFIIPAIPFSALSAIYRGYFQGFSKMAPTAISEITEQIAEVWLTLLLVLGLARLLPFSAYSYPLAGLTMGEIVCFVTLIWFLKRQTKVDQAEYNEASLPRMQILRYSWPLLMNQVVASISLASEGIIIPYLLGRSGYSPQDSTGLFGIMTGMAEPVAFFPLIFLYPLASVLSPQISSAFKTKSLAKIEPKIVLFYLSGLCFCLLSAVIIYMTAFPLTQFLYKSITPVYLVRILLISLPFTGIAVLNITVLAAVGATDKILMLSLWVIGLKVFLFYVFVPFLGIDGAAWTVNITQIFIALASWAELQPFLPKPASSSLPKFLRPSRFQAEHP